MEEFENVEIFTGKILATQRNNNGIPEKMIICMLVPNIKLKPELKEEVGQLSQYIADKIGEIMEKNSE